MARVRVHEDGQLPWTTIEAGVSPDEMFLGSRYRIHEAGTAETLQLVEADYLPGTVVDVHAHHEDEIVFVVAGTMMVGARSLGPGSSVFVAGGTLYSFAAGPDGLRFVNFRGARDDSFISREEYQAARTARRSDTDAPAQQAIGSG